MFKTCTKCNIEKCIEEFSLRGHESGRLPRLRSECRCWSQKYHHNHNKKKTAEKQALRLSKPSSSPTHKICTRCKIEKECNIVEFCATTKNTLGLTPRCRKCINRDQRDYEAKNRKPNKFRHSEKEGHKICRRCNKELLLDKFRISKRKRNNYKPLYESHCLSCETEVKKIDRAKNPQKYKEISKRSNIKHGDKIRTTNRAKYWENLEINRAKQREKSKKPKTKAAQKEWYKNNREHMRAYYRNRRRTDPIHKLAANLRNRTLAAFKKGSFSKNSSLSVYLGCTMDKFKAHIEFLFKPGMTWNNYGKEINEWNLDHTVPLSCAENEEEMYKLCHYSNVAPMWFIYNIKKGNRTTDQWVAYKLLQNIDESIPPISLRS